MKKAKVVDIRNLLFKVTVSGKVSFEILANQFVEVNNMVQMKEQ